MLECGKLEEDMKAKLEEDMKAKFEKDYKIICEVVDSTRLISERVKKLENMGYLVFEFPMGSGGVKQKKELQNETRIQIGYGHGRHNYAYAVQLRHFQF